MTSYRLNGGEQRRPVTGPLPEGDYQFQVAEYQEPYQKANGNWVLKVRLTIEGQTIFDHPWSGTEALWLSYPEHSEGRRYYESLDAREEQ